MVLRLMRDEEEEQFDDARLAGSVLGKDA